MSPVFDCTTSEGRAAGIDAAKAAIADDECIVLPTDTVYGIGADAFSVTGVTNLLAAKGRGRDMPPPVLIPDVRTVDGLAMSVPSYARRLMEDLWPGGLTLIFRSQPSLMWDLGDTNGTVGLRMPDDEVSLALLAQTGPLAVSSANQTGKPAATTVTEAGFALGPSVDVYLDGGPRGDQVPSTILDCTKADPVVMRPGAVSNERLREVLAGVELVIGYEINDEFAPVDLDKHMDDAGDADVDKHPETTDSDQP
ncbi:L-threonylcarbamoyladenylate synthase [Leekyejoonella antrihumi]|uniref:L-threonylcarbamoyladenylate synthase n=1 Tax=Leekyejoonella antrihumi TaxID=1660198 RepID=A0A563E1V7_9MICO|nr:L-threonylcarbamoyladenylate synthase [Leekyejoonella antrihumi]TWP36506.1 threonylcarbamoyl-AMP synthase [Leekyejoonella antrihumi]